MSRRAFTLIELLVVIAIIVLFLAILVPSLQNVRQYAKTVLCSSNVKQLVLGLAMYETENDTFPHSIYDTLPELPPGGYPGNPAFDRKGWWWFNYISDYSRKNKGRKAALWCPSRQVKDIRLKDYMLHGNYGVNRSICKSSDDIQSHRKEFAGTPLSSSDIPHPGRTLLIVDSGYILLSWWHATDVPPIAFGSTIEDTAYVPGLEINKKKDLWPGQHQDAIYGRHPSKSVNVGFADGHVSRKKADDLCVEKIADDYKNKNPLWQPK